tara:strand:+ start:272 stop:547 length:276 start_codon:yes stop_codon:yes gene_type:complete
MEINIKNLDLIEYSMVDDGCWFTSTIKEKYMCKETGALVTVEARLHHGDDKLRLCSDDICMEYLVDKVYEIMMDPNFPEKAAKEYILGKIK